MTIGATTRTQSRFGSQPAPSDRSRIIGPRNQPSLRRLSHYALSLLKHGTKAASLSSELLEPVTFLIFFPPASVQRPIRKVFHRLTCYLDCLVIIEHGKPNGRWSYLLRVSINPTKSSRYAGGKCFNFRPFMLQLRRCSLRTIGRRKVSCISVYKPL